MKIDNLVVPPCAVEARPTKQGFDPQLTL